MSDSDWSDEEDADVLMPGEVKPEPIPPPASAQQPASKANNPSQAEAAVSPSKSPQASKQPAKPEIVVALPVVVYLTASSPGKAAGVSVLADAALHTFSFLVYDQNRRTLVYEPVTANSAPVSAAKQEWTGEPALPFEVKLDGLFEEGRLKLLDKEKRWWLLAFTSRPHCLRFLSFYLLSASLAARDGVTCKTIVLASGDRSGKRAKSYAAVKLRCWSVSESLDSLKALDTVFDPLLANDASLVEDVKVTELKESVPVTLGQTLNRVRVGTKTLLAFPLDSAIAEDLRGMHGIPLDGAARVVIAYVEVFEVYKKRRHKKKSKTRALPAPSGTPAPVTPPPAASPEPSSSPNPTPAAPTPTPTPTPAPTPAEPKSQPVHEAPSTQSVPVPPAPQTVSGPTPAVVAVPSVGTAVVPVSDDQGLSFEEEFNEVCETIQATQDKILKRTLNDMYLRVVAELDLDAEAAEEDTLPSAKVLDAIRSSMRAAIDGFFQYNSNDVPGTLTSLTALQPKFKLHQESAPPSTDAHISSESQAQIAKLQARVAQLEQDLNFEEVKHAQAIKAKDELGYKQMELATTNMDLEAKLVAAQQNAAKYKAQADELKVFEQATSEMRKLLDSEIEARRETEDSFDQLLRQQNKFKLNWFPKKDVENCLLCGDRFKMFGDKSRQHCRHCGRVFCKPCSRHEIALPEIGFQKPVRVCTWCYEFKTGRRLQADEDAAVSAPEEVNQAQQSIATDRKSFLSGLTADYSDDDEY